MVWVSRMGKKGGKGKKKKVMPAAKIPQFNPPRVQWGSDTHEALLHALLVWCVASAGGENGVTVLQCTVVQDWDEDPKN